MTERVIFVTGTDTGVGKTVVTALLLAHLLRKSGPVLALKPFCSGDRNDAELLWELQGRRIPIETINPFYFTEPIAPWSAARRKGSSVRREDVVHLIEEHSSACDVLLVEGAGGLLSPLGDRFNLADLIDDLCAEVIVVAPNRLGVLNHTLLVCESLRSRSISDIRIALVNSSSPDESAKTNFQDLQELLAPLPVIQIPYLADYLPTAECVRSKAIALHDKLENLLVLGKKNPPDTEPRGLFP